MFDHWSTWKIWKQEWMFLQLFSFLTSASAPSWKMMSLLLWINLQSKREIKNGFGYSKIPPWIKHTISHKKKLMSLNKNHKFHFFKTTSELRPKYQEAFNFYHIFQSKHGLVLLLSTTKTVLSNYLHHSTVLLYWIVGQDSQNLWRLSFHHHCTQR